MLTEKQFDLLLCLKKRKKKDFTQRELAAQTGMSLGSVNSELKALIEKGYVSDKDSYTVTKKGSTQLKPYKVDNAIIIAAGFSSRFVPLSYELPKGRLEVRGEVLIERQIKQLLEAGIKDIIIVLGYLKEEFYYLEDMFKEVTLLFNPDYASYNNISTLLEARKYIKNSLICSSDNYFVDNPFEQYVYKPYYSCVYQSGPTDEYVVTTGAHNRIEAVEVGGRDSYIMLGEVFWDKNFSDKFFKIVDEEWHLDETRQKLWEDLYIDYIDELDLYMKEADRESVWEFDSIDDVRDFDPHFVINADSKVFHNICKTLSCEPDDIKGFLPIKKGLTNNSFSFYVHGQRYVYRHPGIGSDLLIDRKREKQANKQASALGIDPSFFAMSKKKGWKISRFEEDFRELDYKSFDDLDLLFETVFTYQSNPPKKLRRMSYMEEGDHLLKILRKRGRMELENLQKLEKRAKKLYKKMQADDYEEVMCHHDLYAPNIFISNEDNTLTLIDWEYAGLDDPSSDFGSLITNGEYSIEEAQEILKRYYKITPEERPRDFAHYISAVGINAYFWFIWAVYKEMIGNPMGELQYYYYTMAKQYIALGRSLYKNLKE